MDKNKLKNVLQYAKSSIQHPEARVNEFGFVMMTDGVQLRKYPSSEQVLKDASERSSKIKDYENFIKEINDLIQQLENE